jgi:hypothetical protein
MTIATPHTPRGGEPKCRSHGHLDPAPTPRDHGGFGLPWGVNFRIMNRPALD